MNAIERMHSSSAGPLPSDSNRLREVTGQVVGSVFYATMLKTMRDNRLSGKYGHGGRGEEMFAAQLHGVLAERMGASQRHGLAAALYQRLEKQQRLVDQAAARTEKGRILR